MPTQDVNSFIPQEAITRLQQYKDLVQSSAVDLAALAKNAREAGTAIGDAKGLNELARATAASNKALAELAKTKAQLERAEREVINTITAEERARTQEARTAVESERKKTEATRQSTEASRQATEAARQSRIANQQAIDTQREADRQADRLARASRRVSDAYTQLSDKYRQAAQDAKRLAAEELARGNSLQNLSQQTIAAIRNARNLHDQLLAIESATGDNRRNVGNYTSAMRGLRLEISQVAREAPNFALDFRTGVIALSNNLPLLQQSIQQVRAENAALRAEGKPTTSVFKQIVAGIFSWQTALIVLITALVANAKAVETWFTNLIYGRNAARDAELAYEKAMSEAAKTTASEISSIQANIQIVRDQNATNKERYDAYQKLAQQAPERFGQLSMEQVLTSDLTGAIEAQVAAITRKTQIGAREKVYNEALEKQLQAQQKLSNFMEGNERTYLNTDQGDLDNILLGLARANEAVTVSYKNLNNEIGNSNGQREAQLKFVGQQIAQTEKALNAERSGIGVNQNLVENYTNQLKNLYNVRQALIDQQRVGTAAPIDRADDPYEVNVQNQKIALSQTTKDTRAELDARAQLIRAESLQKQAALSKEYRYEKNLRETNFTENADYIRRSQLIQAESEKAISDLKEQYETKFASQRKKRDGEESKALRLQREREAAALHGRLSLIEEEQKLRKQQLEYDVEINKQGYEDESRSLQERLNAYSDYQQARSAQLRNEQQQEQRIVAEKLRRIDELQTKSYDKLTAEEKNLLAEREALGITQSRIVAKYVADEAELNRIAQKDITRIIEQEAQKRAAARKAAMKAEKDDLDLRIAQNNESLSDQESEELSALSGRLRKGSMSREQYQREQQKIGRAYDVQELLDAQYLTEQLISRRKELGEETNDLEEESAKTSKKINDLLNKDRIKSDEEYAEARAKIIQGLQQLAQESLNSIVSLSKAYADEELQRLEKQADQIEKNKDLQIAAINATTLTEAERQAVLEKYNLTNASSEEKAAAFQEEKQRRIAEAEARAAAQREQLQQREIQIKQKQARFERAVTIAQIIARTAEAVVSQLSIPVGGIALAAIAAAIGAVQLATVIATPLPQYELGAGIDGRPLHSGGYARVGEKGQLEYVIEPGRQPYAVSHDHVRYLAPQTAVLPAARLAQLGYDQLAPNITADLTPFRGNRRDNADVVSAINGLKKEVRRSSKAPQVRVSVHGEWNAYVRKNTK